jgi:hypothetical protein
MLDNNEHYFLSQNLALPQDSHYFRESTAESRVLLEKLIFAQLLKTFSAFYGTRRLITTYTQYSNNAKLHGTCTYETDAVTTRGG